MAYSFNHSGASLPVRLTLEQTEIQQACPSCARAGTETEVHLTVSVERTSGMTLAHCEAGHAVMVRWQREDDPPAP